MPLAVGARLGPYEILGPLGTGGMGEVYRARDTRLDRIVAIKVAHERFEDRFAREAQAIARLNHPHICTLHDVGPDYLVMELIEGETLAARLRKGPMEMAQAITLAAEIADGLAAAHAAGVVHRDLKPQNIMIARSGIKILDFGIAKRAHDVTQTGTADVLGTPAYMPPEQRSGGPTDARTDHYALGLVLLEMLSGRRPDPVQPEIPPGLNPLATQAIARCLSQAPEDRWQSASDLASVLELAANHGGAITENAARSTRSRAIAVAAVAVAVAAIVVIGWPRSPVSVAPVRLTISAPEGTTFPTVQRGGPPAVSPDGRAIAFVAEGASGRRLWVRSLDSFEARQVPGSEGAVSPSWSPDGRSLMFSDLVNLKRVDLQSGEVRALTGTVLAGPAAWSNQGQILWSNGGELFAIPAGGGDRSAETTRDATLFEENHYAPSFLPDGRHYLVLIRGGVELGLQLCVGEIGSKERRILLSGVTAASYAPAVSNNSGWLLYVREARLMSRPFDLDRLTFTGDAVPVADQVAEHGFGIIGDFSVSQTGIGVLAYRVAAPVTQELAWFDRSGRNVDGLGDRPGNRRNNVRLSPDSRMVAFTRLQNDVSDVWIHDLARKVDSRLTFDGGRSPVWSPDGTEIAYLHQDTIIRKRVAGGTEVAVWKDASLLAINDWSGDGRHLILTRWQTASGIDGRGLWLLSDIEKPVADRTPTLLAASRALHGMFSPASGTPELIAFDSRGQTFVRRMPGAQEGRWQVSVDGGNGVRWRRDGRELYFISGQTLQAVTVTAGPVFGAPQTLFGTPGALRTAMSQYALGYDAAADGLRFLMTFPQSETPATVINVVINWQSALQGK